MRILARMVLAAIATHSFYPHCMLRDVAPFAPGGGVETAGSVSMHAIDGGWVLRIILCWGTNIDSTQPV